MFKSSFVLLADIALLFTGNDWLSRPTSLSKSGILDIAHVFTYVSYLLMREGFFLRDISIIIYRESFDGMAASLLPFSLS